MGRLLICLNASWISEIERIIGLRVKSETHFIIGFKFCATSGLTQLSWTLLALECSFELFPRLAGAEDGLVLQPAEGG